MCVTARRAEGEGGGGVKIAVALLTCDRSEYTARTVRTFIEKNRDLSRFVLLHGDDGSEDDTNTRIANDAGFTTILRTGERLGWRFSRPPLLDRAARFADWIFLLENDIESLRPFPWALFDYVRPDPRVYCLRLYGRWKDKARMDRCLETHKRKSHQPVEWRALKGAPEAAQIGEIHWSAQPCVTRSKQILRLHKNGVEPTGLTVRVKKNVVSHFGAERTLPRPVEATC